MKDLLSWQSFLLFASMLAVTYSTRLIGFFALRNRTLSRRAQIVMEAAPGCVLISVIAPYFVSDKPHELIAIVLTVLAASRFSMLVTVLIGVGEVYAHVFVCRFLQHVARAGIVFAFLNIEFSNRFRVLPQAGVDGVEAIDESLVCHDFAL